MFHPYLLLCRVSWVSECSPAYTRHKPCRRQTALFCANSRKFCAFGNQSVFRLQQPLAARCFVPNTFFAIYGGRGNSQEAVFQLLRMGRAKTWGFWLIAERIGGESTFDPSFVCWQAGERYYSVLFIFVRKQPGTLRANDKTESSTHAPRRKTKYGNDAP